MLFTECLEKYTTAPNYYVVGDFTTIGDVKLNGIGFVDYQGNVAKANSSNFAAENGLMIDAEDLFTSSYIKSISSFSDGRMLVSGAFSAYYSWNGHSPASKKDRVYGDNIMILNSNASADTICRIYWETENNWQNKNMSDSRP